MRHAVHHQLELAFDDADHLLVRVVMLGERRAGIDVDPRMRHAIGVNEARAQAGKDLTDAELVQGNQGHAPSYLRQQPEAAGLREVPEVAVGRDKAHVVVQAALRDQRIGQTRPVARRQHL